MKAFEELIEVELRDSGIDDGELLNQMLIARDRLLFGNVFVDVTGKRIDPACIQPSSGASDAL